MLTPTEDISSLPGEGTENIRYYQPLTYFPPPANNIRLVEVVAILINKMKRTKIKEYIGFIIDIRVGLW